MKTIVFANVYLLVVVFFFLFFFKCIHLFHIYMILYVCFVSNNSTAKQLLLSFVPISYFCMFFFFLFSSSLMSSFIVLNSKISAMRYIAHSPHIIYIHV